MNRGVDDDALPGIECAAALGEDNIMNFVPFAPVIVGTESTAILAELERPDFVLGDPYPSRMLIRQQCRDRRLATSARAGHDKNA